MLQSWLRPWAKSFRNSWLLRCKHEAQFWKQSFLFPTTSIKGLSAANSREYCSEFNIIQQNDRHGGMRILPSWQKITRHLSSIKKQKQLLCMVIGGLEPSWLTEFVSLLSLEIKSFSMYCTKKAMSELQNSNNRKKKQQQQQICQQKEPKEKHRADKTARRPSARVIAKRLLISDFSYKRKQAARTFQATWLLG